MVLDKYMLIINLLIRLLPYILLGFIPFVKKLKMPIYKVIIIFIILYSINVVVALLLYNIGWSLDVISLILFIVFSVLFMSVYNLSIKEGLEVKLFVYIVLACYSVFMDSMVGYARSIISFSPADNVMSQTFENISMTIGYAITMPFLARILIYKVLPIFDELNDTSFKYMWVIPASYTVGLAVYSQIVDYNSENYWKYLLFFCVFTAITMITYAVFYNFLKTERDKEKLSQNVDASTQLLEMQAKRFKTLTENINETRAVRHDMRHQLSALSTILEQGDINKAKVFLEQYRLSIPGFETPICNNFAVDAICKHYFNIAKNNNIAVHHELDLPDSTRVTNTDLCIIIGNLVENAIEAINRMTIGEKVLKVKAKLVGNNMVIAVDNPYEEEIKKSGGSYISSKRENETGIGISSVESIVIKYGGSMCIKENNKIFAVTIIIDNE